MQIGDARLQVAQRPLAQLHVPFDRTGVRRPRRGHRAGIGGRPRSAQVVHADGVARGQRRQRPAQVLQFAHVARPVQRLQGGQGGRVEALGTGAELARRAAQEGFGQQRDVGATLAQRRDAQPHHVQPVQQVGAETALGHPRLQVLVGGGDHPHVDPDQLASADPEKLALGQHPQQPGLQRGRHVADLVQEQGAAMGLFETADMAPVGAGEGTGLVAEQFALQQLGRDGGGIERHERSGRARRFAVQGAGHQLLAGAGFAGDQHRQRHLGQAADGAEQGAHGRGVTDQLLPGRFLRVGPGIRFHGHRYRHACGRQGARGQRHRVVQVEGLGQEFVGATAERAGGAGHIGIGRHHDHRQLRMRRLEPVQQLEPVFAGHAHIGEQQVRRTTRLQRLQRAGRVLETVHRVAGFAQRGGQHEAHRAVVIDHPDPALGIAGVHSGPLMAWSLLPVRCAATAG